MEMNIHLKHLFHVTAFCLFIALLVIGSIYQKADNADSRQYEQYGIGLTIFLHVIQYIVVLSLPQIICNFLGLTLFNSFPGRVKIRSQCNLPLKSVDLPHLCFRVVTRGLYPDLVQQNVNRNHLTCVEAGLSNFSIE